MNLEVPKPDNYSEKEVYCFFGLASYSGQTLEKCITNIVLALIVSQTTMISLKQLDFSLSKITKKTLGQLISDLKKHVNVSGELEKTLTIVLKKRNWLNHNYFFDEAEQFMSKTGRANMIDKLRNTIKLFQETEDTLIAIYSNLLEKLNISHDTIVTRLIRNTSEN